MRFSWLLLLSLLSFKLWSEEAMTGQATYEQFCITCHQDGLVGAPKFGYKKDWDKHLAGKTIDDLVTSAMHGLNAMPAQGTCSECSAEDIKAAIIYMLPKP
jgi:cytochrome c5